MISRSVTVIVKVTNACDMRCRYCFIEPAIAGKTMSVATARRVVRAFLDSAHFSDVSFVWHGGEPLLRGCRFFQQVFAEQRRRETGVRFENALQTNAMHLDDETLDVLLRDNVQIGLSLDGPATLHDRARIPRGSRPGRSSHAATVQAALRMQAKGLGASALVTVNRCNVDAADAVYDEFRSRRIHMKVNPLTRSGLAATATSADLGISPEEYGAFLVRLSDRWLDDADSPIRIDPIGRHIAHILEQPTPASCSFARGCHRYFLGVAPDGDLFPCGMFQGEPSFRYGNIHDMDPERIGETPLFQLIQQREDRVTKRCSPCTFFEFCYSGCMFHSLKDSRLLDARDFYCSGYKMYFEHLLRRVHAAIAGALAVPGPRPERGRC